MLAQLVAAIALLFHTATGQTLVARTGPIKVVASNTLIADFARNVAGDRATVTSLIPPNADPHTFEATPRDVVTIAGADLVVVHGLGLDAWMDKLIANAGGSAPVVVTTVGITTRPDQESADGDPHVWQDPRLVKGMVDNIAAGLSRVDPAGGDTYSANASAYKERLDRLDAEILAQMQEIPRENRQMVTNHDAFHYYADRYGIVFVGSVIPGSTTEADASAGALGRLIRLMIDRKVKAVFSENTVEPKIVRDIADQTGAKVVSSLVSDALGEPGGPADTYEKMMRYNTRIVVDALR